MTTSSPGGSAAASPGGGAAVPPGPPAFARQVARAPKVLLHDHLDGGLRPGTLIELADAIGYDQLPSTDPDELACWFRDSAAAGSLPDYLRCFAHTHAVMQTADGLFRVASECAQDLAADGVVYAESRFAPDLHCRSGLSTQQVVEAVAAGFADGEARAAERGRTIAMAMLLCGNRQQPSSLATAQLCLANRDGRVAGFDIAGPERGYPPTRHQQSFDLLAAQGVPYTIHAGEDDGLDSIWQAVNQCHARRIGHGVRLIDAVDHPGPQASAVAELVRRNRVCLEMCPTSNVQTGAVGSMADHPLDRLRTLGFAVTVNTDNRLLSGRSLSQEMLTVAELFGYTLADLRALTDSALAAAFLTERDRERIRRETVEPGYRRLLAESEGAQ